MNCGDLAGTGTPVATVLVLAAACVVAGLLLLHMSRTRRGRNAVVLVVLLLTGSLGSGLTADTSARAATSHCVGGGDTGARSPLTITQTSTMTGLAPGVFPAAITGVVVNNVAASIYVTAITVSIVSVTKVAGAVAGRCEASDYLLLDATMPVRQTLVAFGSTDFAGASIGFNDKSIDQDACKGATIGLEYVSSILQAAR